MITTARKMQPKAAAMDEGHASRLPPPARPHVARCDSGDAIERAAIAACRYTASSAVRGCPREDTRLHARVARTRAPVARAPPCWKDPAG